MQRIMKKVGPSLAVESEEMDTAVLTRSNPVDYHRMWSSEAPDSDSSVPTSTLYLFYEHFGLSKSSHSLIKIDLTPAISKEPSLVLDFPSEKYPVKGMKCARLGSKFFFLGGKQKCGYNYVYPRDVYEYDLSTKEFKKVTSLNEGKPCPCVVFAANGELYTLGNIPYWHNMSLVEVSKLSLFECFDPIKNKWTILNNLSPAGNNGVDWMGCTVLRKRNQVVLVGYKTSSSGCVKFVYYPNQKRWTRHDLSWAEGPGTMSFQEGSSDDNYLYGLHNYGPPIKSKSGDYDEEAFFDSNGFAKVRIPGPPYFHQPYLGCATRLVRYLGNNCFCYIACGMLENPLGCSEVYNRGILITLFKVLKKNQEGVCVQTNILHSKDYIITMEDSENSNVWNKTQLVECFAVSPEQLQEDIKKDKKKKTSG